MSNSQSVYGYFGLVPGFVDMFRTYVAARHDYFRIREEVAARHGYDLSVFHPRGNTSGAAFHEEMKSHPMPNEPFFPCLCEPDWHGSDCTDNDVVSLWWLEDKLAVELGYMTQAEFERKHNLTYN